ncbi:hypothetical protein Taro_009195 [Colocasia esculenta]|uniref:Uncharacterized protein n=1 Tax=Colocasia esculenta TaxID=4460 RepID=A0A843U9B4_COLES|nr:hypothetical protein [Colocasia esculenta]
MASRVYPEVMVAVALLFGTLLATPAPADAKVGVCYGMLGNNLPPPTQVVAMYRQHGVGLMRLYYPHTPALQALRGSNIGLILDVPREDIQRLASSASAAADWVNRNVRAYWPAVKLRYIGVGNELIPDAGEARSILPAMRNVHAAISAAGLQKSIKVSTVVHSAVLGKSYPPSASEFSGAAQAILRPIVQFLASTGAPLLANIYPYFAHIYNPRDISLAYAQFTAPGPLVHDGPYAYQNLFDAMVDGMYAALEKVGGARVSIVVSESGWPSAGGAAASVANARTYNQNLIRHVARGTPRRPGKALETYVFAMFNENQKTGAETEKHFGLFYPNKQPVYPISFKSIQQDEADGEGPVYTIISSDSEVFRQLDDPEERPEVYPVGSDSEGFQLDGPDEPAVFPITSDSVQEAVAAE